MATHAMKWLASKSACGRACRSHHVAEPDWRIHPLLAKKACSIFAESFRSSLLLFPRTQEVVQAEKVPTFLAKGGRQRLPPSRAVLPHGWSLFLPSSNLMNLMCAGEQGWPFQLVSLAFDLPRSCSCKPENGDSQECASAKLKHRLFVCSLLRVICCRLPWAIVASWETMARPLDPR